VMPLVDYSKFKNQFVSDARHVSCCQRLISQKNTKIFCESKRGVNLFDSNFHVECDGLETMMVVDCHCKEIPLRRDEYHKGLLFIIVHRMKNTMHILIEDNINSLRN
jgi:hypothetical protein